MDRYTGDSNNHTQDGEDVTEGSFNEEIASEVMEPDMIDDEEVQEHNDQDVKNVYGWIAIALSVVSFFFVPILFAGAGVILGFIARNKDATILGNTAITIGVVSVLIRLFIMPLI